MTWFMKPKFTRTPPSDATPRSGIHANVSSVRERIWQEEQGAGQTRLKILQKVLSGDRCGSKKFGCLGNILQFRWFKVSSIISETEIFGEDLQFL